MFTAGQVDPTKTMGQNPSLDSQFLVLKAVSLFYPCKLDFSYFSVCDGYKLNLRVIKDAVHKHKRTTDDS